MLVILTNFVCVLMQFYISGILGWSALRIVVVAVSALIIAGKFWLLWRSAPK